MRTPDRLQITYVTAEGCHFCERGYEVLQELADLFPVDVRIIDLTSDEGRHVAARWQIPFPPIVLVGGVLVAYGRLSLRRLARDFEDLATSAEPLAAFALGAAAVRSSPTRSAAGHHGAATVIDPS